MKRLLTAILIALLCVESLAQEVVPQNLLKIKPTRQLVNFLELDSNVQTKPNFNYRLILSKSNWYAVGNGDGQVFVSDGGKWRRADNTRLEGYHYGAFLFDCNGLLMKYGGYGFWRTHGMFVYFHEGKGDWVIQPANRDIPFSGEMAFFNRRENNLYSFGSFLYNQSISDEKKFLDSLYRIDLLEMKWENLGKLNPTLSQKYHLHHRLSTLENQDGCLVLPVSNDSSAIYLDFNKLQFNIYNPQSNPELYNFLRNQSANFQLYSDSYGLKLLSQDSIKTVDSLSWERALSSPVLSAELISSNQTFFILKSGWLYATISLLLGVLFLYTRNKNIKINKTIVSEESKTNKLDLTISNTLRFEGAMYPISPEDYKVILLFAKQDATTIDLNDWLGLENKLPENQKKQRAEWIKRMNAFFASIGFSDLAFSRERQETDKRMFVYKMSSAFNIQLPLAKD